MPGKLLGAGEEGVVFGGAGPGAHLGGKPGAALAAQLLSVGRVGLAGFRYGMTVVVA
jgi:hypothetical protein